MWPRWPPSMQEAGPKGPSGRGSHLVVQVSAFQGPQEHLVFLDSVAPTSHDPPPGICAVYSPLSHSPCSVVALCDQENVAKVTV